MDGKDVNYDDQLFSIPEETPPTPAEQAEMLQDALEEAASDFESEK